MAGSSKTKPWRSNKNTRSNQLSMKQEARNTEARNLWWDSNQLRHQAVQFVSAGTVDPSNNFESKVNKETKQPIQLQPIAAQSDETGCKKPPEVISQCTAFTHGSSAKQGATGRCSPTSDNSSEDEIIFNGRRKKTQQASDVPAESLFLPIEDGQWQEKTDYELPQHTLVTPALDLTPCIDAIDSQSSELDGTSPTYVAIENISDTGSETSEEDDLLADYIANIDEDYEYLNISVPRRPELTPLEGGISSQESSGFLQMPGDSHDNSPDDSELELESSDDRDPTYNGHAIDKALEYLDAKGKTEARKAFPVHSRSDAKGRRNGFFASATAFADALELDPYYGFDVMDFSRPSLRKQRKGRSHRPNLELLDSDFGSELENAAKNVTSKKRLRKQEREELRRQGLLGRKGYDPDLKAKYAQGINIDDLKSEIRNFLLSQKNSLPLPPMTKHRRLLVHEMANALSLNSKSRGKGTSRFPVLFKTSRTPQYTHKTISETEKIFSKQRFSSRAVKPWAKSVGKQVKGNRGHTSVSYTDGDIVGASAPEIGAENKGRAMLEKMGWSTGTPLGATHNKGILLPVAQVVKNSKAGLG